MEVTVVQVPAYCIKKNLRLRASLGQAQLRAKKTLFIIHTGEAKYVIHSSQSQIFKHLMNLKTAEQCNGVS